VAIYKSDNIFERLDLSLVRHFFAIATFGGFSKASRATGISQPALSLGLQKLEKTLGTKLIDRKPGNFSLTDSGKVVHAFCKRLEGNLESMVGDLGAGKISVPRRLRIGTGLSVGFGPLVRACIQSRRSDQAVELELTARNTYDLLEDVHEGKLDAALVPDDVFDKRLKLTPLFRDKLVFVHGAAQASAFAARNWASRTLNSVLVTYPRETPMRAVVDTLCGKHDLRFKSVISVNGLDAIKGLVRRGVGGAFVLKSLVSEELRKKELRESKVPFELPLAGVALVTSHGESGAEATRMLKQWL
jgi:LysR family hydrogen peroxide-inducible transcriptional activator